MGFDSNGRWTSDFYPINDRDNNVPILASKLQELIQNNLKQSFENCLLRDGTGRPNANINWNGNKILNLGNGTSTKDAVNKGQLDDATYDIATEQEAIDGTSDDTIITPAKLKKVLTVGTNTRFCVNGGYATSGKPDLLGGTGTSTLRFKIDDGTVYRPLVATTAAGFSFELEFVETYDVSAMDDGIYNVFVDSTGAAFLYDNVVYRQPNQPTELNTNDIWFNTCEPYSAYIKTSNSLIECDLVQLPQIVVVESNVISAINTVDLFNDNGSRIFRKLRESYINGGSWYKVFDEYNPLNGFFVGRWCEQGGSVEGGSIKTVTFLKPFADTNYTVVSTPVFRSGDYSTTMRGISDKTSTSVSVDSRYLGAEWYACGYIL